MPVSGSLTFQIPEGRVYVPRALFFYPSRTFTTVSSTGTTILPVTMSLFNNNTAVPEMTNIDLTFSENENEYPLHFIAPIDGNIVVELTASTPSDTIFDVAVIMYGNSILSTGRPLNMEIATRMKRISDIRTGDVIFPEEGQTE